MKKFIFTLVLILPLVLPLAAFAETMTFQCTSVDLEIFHKFDAHGVVSIDDDENVEGVANVITQKAGAVQSSQTFDEVHITGKIRHFKAGELTRYAFDQLILKTDSDYLKSLNLLLGVSEQVASHALSVDNFNYRSNCKITDISK